MVAGARGWKPKSNGWSFKWRSRTATGATRELSVRYQILDTTWREYCDILKRDGVEPAPERNRKTTWKEFLTQHWDLIVAADFFTIEVWTAKAAAVHRSLLSCHPDVWRSAEGRSERTLDEPGCGM